MQRQIPTEFSRVLRRYDRDPRIEQRFQGYNCVVRSLSVELEGVVAPTLFFPPGKGVTADRAMALGWRDETRRWVSANRGDAAPTRDLAPLEHALSEMEWNSLRQFAHDRDLDCSGKRSDIEGRILDWYAARPVDKD